MTRFARSKGSKASNERIPEQATSWSEMRQDLLNKNKDSEERHQREEALKRRSENYQAFLQEKEMEEESKVTWAEFQEVDHNNSSKKRKISNNSPKKLPKKIKTESPKTDVTSKNRLISDESDSELNALKLKIEDVLKKQNKPTDLESDSDAAPDVAGIKEKPKEIIVKKVKRKKPKIQIVLNGSKDDSKEKSNEGNIENDIKKGNEDVVLTDKDKKKIAKKKERYLKRLEKKKRLRQEKKISRMQGSNTTNNKSMDVSGDSSNKNELSDQDLLNIAKKKNKKIRQLEMKKKFKEANSQKPENSDKTESENLSINNNLNEQSVVKYDKKKQNGIKSIEKKKEFKETEKNEFVDKTNESETFSIQKKKSINLKADSKDKKNIKEKRKVKNRDGKDHKRRKPASETVLINGKSVEIGFVDGFPVKKEDADRLKQLRREMITKGLPRSQIDAALKLERRRAEKALAREKKNVCFNCRMSGHVLSECPELGKDQVAQSSGTGICFKCGSTEHTHFECKVVKGMDYKFAQCFICNEQGHIARQCPDNQRGLYPKGGSCNVCGDVTHLKKDCPKYQAQQAQLKDSFNIGTLNNSNPDNLDIADSNNSFRPTKKPLNKIIKF
ncbi:hypothetical protein GWI33_017904 [Rhynchophorus ferrugineus]|uniref:CCHC-type domain-containing protein n=1 Tax=Rhynchophorus ferrugineus TaxID=354439 RepID=A0A834I8A0_RHYFE|nr:hypothetical protein GWI33_017904 [Rhynchophorus ferrugineus]